MYDKTESLDRKHEDVIHRDMIKQLAYPERERLNTREQANVLSATQTWQSHRLPSLQTTVLIICPSL